MNKSERIINKINTFEVDDLTPLLKKIMDRVVNVSKSDQKELDSILDDFCSKYDPKGTDVMTAVKRAGLTAAKMLWDKLSVLDTD